MVPEKKTDLEQVKEKHDPPKDKGKCLAEASKSFEERLTNKQFT